MAVAMGVGASSFLPWTHDPNHSLTLPCSCIARVRGGLAAVGDRILPQRATHAAQVEAGIGPLRKDLVGLISSSCFLFTHLPPSLSLIHIHPRYISSCTLPLSLFLAITSISAEEESGSKGQSVSDFFKVDTWRGVVWRGVVWRGVGGVVWVA